MLNTLLDNPLLFGALIIFAVLALQFILRRVANVRQAPKINDVVGFYLALVGALYGIALAFILTAAWDNQEKARELTDQEAQSLASVAFYARALPHPLDDTVVKQAKLYATTVEHDEWPSFAQTGEPSHRLAEVSAQLGRDVLSFQPKTARDSEVDDNILESYDSLRALCNSRRDKADYEIPPAIWYLLVFGGIATVGLCVLLDVESGILHLLQTGLVTGFITMSLLVTWDLQNPFQGYSNVSDKPFVDLKDDFFLQTKDWDELSADTHRKIPERIENELSKGEAKPEETPQSGARPEKADTAKAP